MSTPFLGEIRIMSFNFAPRSWAQCNGQLLPIAQNQALFALLGTTYGGNGQTNFALPDFRGRVPVSFGGSFSLGQASGEENHTLNALEVPPHTHAMRAVSGPGTSASPAGAFFAAHRGGYAEAGAVTAPVSTSAVGGLPHPNLPPYLVLNFCIALTGIFPSRN